MSREVGIGYSGPAIVGGRLFTAGAEGKKEFLLCLDAATGKKLWATEVGELYTNDWGDGPRGTPSVDGDRVYFLSGRGDLVCARASNGKIVWKKAVRDMQTRIPRWGFGESVLIDGGQLVCTPGGEGGTMAAFDKMSGALRWQSKEFTDGAQYSSVRAIEVEGQRQYVQITKEHVFAVSAEDGTLRWQHDFPGRTVIPTPVVRAPHVFVSAGDGSGCMLLKAGASSVEQVYANKTMKNHHGGVILLGDHLYGHSDPIGWVCQEFLTGEQVWAERGKLRKGHLTFAGGRFYCVEEDTGTVALVEMSPAGWREVSRFTLTPQTTQRSRQGRIWTHPVVANGRLYLRDQELQFCFDVRAQ
jgi:outer membrane protein assembly factor BamB